MNDKLKNAEQKEIILKYNADLKKCIEDTYNDFSKQQDVVNFQQSVEKHMDVLNKIKDDILLDTCQKDTLFKNYYIFLIDGCDDVSNANDKHYMRQIIFNHLKDKQLFSSAQFVVEIIKDKFTKEMEEMKRKFNEAVKQAQLKQTLENERQQLQSEQLRQQYNERQNVQKNALQYKDDIQQNNNNNGYYDDIANNFANPRMDNYNSYINGYNLQQNINFERQAALKPTFNPDDFYRYQNISNVITNRTEALLEDEYNFVLNEIKNAKNEKNLSEKSGNKNNIDNNKFPNLTQKDSQAVMNLLMGMKKQQEMNKDGTKQAYNKSNKDVQNSIGCNDDKIVDKNSLNSSLLEQQQI